VVGPIRLSCSVLTGDPQETLEAAPRSRLAIPTLRVRDLVRSHKPRVRRKNPTLVTWS